MTNQVRDLLAKALPDSQPTSLTTQQMLAAGRRRQVRRRVGHLSGATTAVALLAAGGLLVPALLDGTPQPSDPRPDAVAAEPEQPPTAIEELSEQIRALFAAELPDLRMSPESWGDPLHRNGEPFELVDPDEMPGSGPGRMADLAGAAFLTTNQGEPAGRVEIRLYRPGDWTDQPANTIGGPDLLEDPIHNPALVSCWSGSYDTSDDGHPPVTTKGIVETQCDRSTTADGGELITVHGEEYNQGQPRSSFSRSWNTVVAFRPDGTAVKAENVCSNEAVDDDETNHCFDLRLTIDQLASIVAGTPPVPAG